MRAIPKSASECAKAAGSCDRLARLNYEYTWRRRGGISRIEELNMLLDASYRLVLSFLSSITVLLVHNHAQHSHAEYSSN